MQAHNQGVQEVWYPHPNLQKKFTFYLKNCYKNVQILVYCPGGGT